MTIHSTVFNAPLPIDPPAVHPAKHPLPARNIEDFAQKRRGIHVGRRRTLVR